MLDELKTDSPARDASGTSALSKAPELWSERVGRKERPIAFIHRVYADHLPYLNRADIRRLDPALYGALAVWEMRHPADRLNELPPRMDTPGRHALSLAK